MYSTNLDLILSFSLTILVVLTLIALGFTSLCSCFRRRQPYSPDHSTSPTASAAGNTHLLNSFPIIIYESSPHSSPSNSPPNCSICLGEFERGEEVRVLPKCSHMFHRICIDEWLPVKSLQCPVCRSFAIEEEEGNVNGGEGMRRTNCVNNRRMMSSDDNGTVSPSTSLSISFGVTSLHHASML